MWWTQPRLAALFSLLYAVVFGVVVVAAADVRVQATTLAAMIVVIVLAYRRLSRELARRHESGASRVAFDRAIWLRTWRQSDPFDFCDLATALDTESGKSGCRGERFHQPLADAMGKVEAARLRVPQNWAALTAGLALSWLMLHVTWFSDVQRIAAGSAVIPFVATSFLGTLVDRAAFNDLLRRSTIERVAFLAPRTIADVGLGWGARLRAPLMIVMSFILAFLALRMWGRDWHNGIVVLCVAAYVALIPLAENFVLLRLPLLRFPGPPEVSAFIDHRIRTARLLLLMAPASLVIVAAGGLARDFNFIAGVASGSVVIGVFIFAWRPEMMAQQKSPLDLAAHLHKLQRQWGLSAEAPGTAELPAELGEAPR